MSLLVLIGPFASLCVLMGPYASLCVPVSFYRLFCVFKDFKGPYGPYRSVCVLMVSNGFFWVLIGRYESLRYLMNPYGS